MFPWNKEVKFDNHFSIFQITIYWKKKFNPTLFQEVTGDRKLLKMTVYKGKFCTCFPTKRGVVYTVR